MHLLPVIGSLIVLLGATAMGPLVRAAEVSNLTFYVQLVRGTDDGAPPAPGSKAIGPKLAAHLQSIYAWKHYWEVHRQEVALAPGQKSRVRLSPEREVQIDLGQPGKWTVTTFSQGKAVARMTEPLASVMTVTGGDRADRAAWFIVARRDKPSVE